MSVIPPEIEPALLTRSIVSVMVVLTVPPTDPVRLTVPLWVKLNVPVPLTAPARTVLPAVHTMSVPPFN